MADLAAFKAALVLDMATGLSLPCFSKRGKTGSWFLIFKFCASEFAFVDRDIQSGMIYYDCSGELK